MGLDCDTEALYEFMKALASEQLNPMIIPPDILQNILQEVQKDIKTNARLKLPDDPITSIWSYYGMTKLNTHSFGELFDVSPNCTPHRHFLADELYTRFITYQLYIPNYRYKLIMNLKGVILLLSSTICMLPYQMKKMLGCVLLLKGIYVSLTKPFIL